MRRTTISLPDDLVERLERESHRRRVSVSELTREALLAKYAPRSSELGTLPFAALGRSGTSTTARDVDEILEGDWSVDRDR